MTVVFFIRAVLAALRGEIGFGDVLAYTAYQSGVQTGRIVEPPSD